MAQLLVYARQHSPGSSPRQDQCFVFLGKTLDCSTLTVPLSTQVYEWVPSKLNNCWMVTLWWTSIPSQLLHVMVTQKKHRTDVLRGFTNSKIIHQVLNKRNHDAVTVNINFGFLMLTTCSIIFLVYLLHFFLVLVPIEKIYQTLKTVFDHISEHHEVC